MVVLFSGGLLGSTHCIGMCGPYVLLCLQTPGLEGGARPLPFGLFTASRLAVYAALGMAAGGAGAMASRAGNAGAAVSIGAGVVALLMGLGLLGILPDPALLLSRAGVDRVVREGFAGARRLDVPSSPLPPAFRKTLLVLALGAVQGLLPCGLVYAFVARAAASGSAAAGGAVMLAFGLGTVPMVTALAFFSGKVSMTLRNRLFRLAGVIVVMGGALLVLRGLADLSLVPHGPAW